MTTQWTVGGGDEERTNEGRKERTNERTKDSILVSPSTSLIYDEG
jgi:hypothetical protein